MLITSRKLQDAWDGARARQVSTHDHGSSSLRLYRSVSKVGHRDYQAIPAGGRWAFPELEGPGYVACLWLTIAGSVLESIVGNRVSAHRSVWIHVFYDGSETPAISAPLGLFFGNGTTRRVHYASKYVGMSSGGYYCYLPMPFARSCRVEIENRHPRREVPLLFGAITYYQLGSLPEGLGRLHATHRDRSFEGSGPVDGSTITNDPHVVLDETGGPGRFVGLSLTIRPTHWLRSRLVWPYVAFPYLEGNLKVYVDDEVTPQGPARIDKPVGAPTGPQSIEWTGVEDYYLSGWYYKTAPFAGPWHGCPVRSWLTGVVSQFRFHELDPYPWRERIRITVNHGEHDQVDCQMESLAFHYRPLR